jgi:predicted DNA-binding protein
MLGFKEALRGLVEMATQTRNPIMIGAMVSTELDAEIERVAQQKEWSKSHIIRKAIESYLATMTA